MLLSVRDETRVVLEEMLRWELEGLHACCVYISVRIHPIYDDECGHTQYDDECGHTQ